MWWSCKSTENYGKTSNLIIGDLDSVNDEIKNKYSDKIINIENQDDNDFRKSLDWISKNLTIEKLFILGATGLREDHAIGNLMTFLYQKFNFNIEIITNKGIFYIVNYKQTIKTSIGQYASIFSIDIKQKITTNGLKYELNNASLDTLYSGTLNTCQNTEMTIQTNSEKPLLVYLAY